MASDADALRLAWSRHGPRDFICRTHDGELIGRIYYSQGTKSRQDTWFWTCNGTYRGRLTSTTGHAVSKDAAAREVEGAWFDAMARIDAALDRGSDGET